MNDIFILADEKGGFNLITAYEEKGPTKVTFKYVNCCNCERDVEKAVWEVDAVLRKRAFLDRLQDKDGKPIVLKLDESRKLDRNSINILEENPSTLFYYVEMEKTVSDSLPSRHHYVNTAIGFSSTSVHFTFRSITDVDTVPNADVIHKSGYEYGDKDVVADGKGYARITREKSNLSFSKEKTSILLVFVDPGVIQHTFVSVKFSDILKSHEGKFVHEMNSKQLLEFLKKKTKSFIHKSKVYHEELGNRSGGANSRGNMKRGGKEETHDEDEKTKSTEGKSKPMAECATVGMEDDVVFPRQRSSNLSSRRAYNASYPAHHTGNNMDENLLRKKRASKDLSRMQRDHMGDTLVSELKSRARKRGCDNVLVVWGDGTFRPGGHGHSCMPVKGLVKRMIHHFVVAVMTEWGTSSKCPVFTCENGRMEDLKLGQVTQQVVDLHGRICDKCTSCWYRDQGSCVSLLCIFSSIMSREEGAAPKLNCALWPKKYSPRKKADSSCGGDEKECDCDCDE